MLELPGVIITERRTLKTYRFHSHIQNATISEMNWSDGLEGTHLAIAKSDSKTIGVLAGPGTGKTTYGLIRRVARLLSEGVPGKEILLLSFTRTAAADLKSKIADLDVPGAEDVQAMTIHSFCFRVLNKESVLVATQRIPRMLLDHEVDLMLRDLDDKFGNIDQRRNLLKAFEGGWVRKIDDYPTASQEKDRDFETQAFQWLRHHKGMLVGEVVPLAYSYLKDNPEAEEHNMFSHIIVDEYQDLNFLEQQLIDFLTETNGASLCIAGDDDQSIYGFRYANPQGILDFMERKGIETHSITVCSRCPRIVLDMANSLIGHAPGRQKENLTSNHKEEGNVVIIQWPALDSEIEGIVTAIISDINEKKRKPGDILVLTHRSKIGTAIRKKLREQGIQVNSYFNEEAVVNDSAQEALALMELVCGNDSVALRVLLGAGDGTGRHAAYKRLCTYAASHNLTEIEVLEQLSSGKKVDGLSIPSLVERYKTASAKATYFKDLDLEKLVDELLPDDSEDVADLRKLALELLPLSEDCRILLNKITAAITQVDVPQHPDFVRVMSLHKSKGLTSPVVYIVGFVEGIVPTIKSSQSDTERNAAVEEQRRLFYVALTRTSDQLVISSSISIELPVAKNLGVSTVPNSIRTVNGKLVAKTVASTYLGELGSRKPQAKKGIDWIASY